MYVAFKKKCFQLNVKNSNKKVIIGWSASGEHCPSALTVFEH